MSIVAFVPVADRDAVNAALSDEFGPDSFSVPMAGDTHIGLHCWDEPAFLAALEAMPNVNVFTSGSIRAVVHFRARWAAVTDESVLTMNGEPVLMHGKPVTMGSA